MDIGTAVGMAGTVITLIAGFVRVMRRLGRIELQIDTMWAWFTEPPPHAPRRGRRRTDPPLTRPLAADAPIKGATSA